MAGEKDAPGQRRVLFSGHVTKVRDQRAPLTRRERLERQLDLAVELAELATDQKTNSYLEGRMRMIAAGLRADAVSIRCGAGREDNMSVNDELSDEARLARANDIREDIERRLARMRTAEESKSVAETAEPRAD